MSDINQKKFDRYKHGMDGKIPQLLLDHEYF